MNVRNCSRFVSECVTSVPGKEPGVCEDDMYGVYLSWCLLNAENPTAWGTFQRPLSRPRILGRRACRHGIGFAKRDGRGPGRDLKVVCPRWARCRPGPVLGTVLPLAAASAPPPTLYLRGLRNVAGAPHLRFEVKGPA